MSSVFEVTFCSPEVGLGVGEVEAVAEPEAVEADVVWAAGVAVGEVVVG